MCFRFKKKHDDNNNNVDKTEDSVIVELHQSLNNLNVKEAFLTKKISLLGKQIINEVKVNKDKQKALNLLKNKKRYEIQLKQISNIINTIEGQIFNLENTNSMKSVFQSMKRGAEHMKKISGNISVSEVDDLSFDMKEQLEKIDNLNEAISMPFTDNEFDEYDLENELDILLGNEIEVENEVDNKIDNENEIKNEIIEVDEVTLTMLEEKEKETKIRNRLKPSFNVKNNNGKRYEVLN